MGNLPIGQGLAVTPIQMATAYSAIANGGVLRAPHVIQAVGDQRGADAARQAGDLRRHGRAACGPCSRACSAAGRHRAEASIPGYVLAGKTGTANKPDPINGGYSKTKYVASFVGFAPAEGPASCWSP